ncbi:WD repeat-containing protein 90-like isoform X1 [Hemicordylus capensis]|uniref:WD repeat-containing protein 90-like isoform X1 n=1 Tax=Hemicordylus capensis TaxID=884348 RepID=UPI002302DBB9|nr:WD repeat-containing protein 90-like isoform X1 [Hemicordylus capensis]
MPQPWSKSSHQQPPCLAAENGDPRQRKISKVVLANISTSSSRMSYPNCQGASYAPSLPAQLYEFTASDEMPRTVAFHPSQQIFACGFDTGVVRTISLAASKLLEEHKQHHDSITGLIFSPDGNFMYSCCARGTLALYNCAVQKSHIVRVLANVVVQDADHGPDALSISADGHLLAFVGPSEYIVTLMDARSLDEVVEKIPLPYFATSLSLSPAACVLAVGFNEHLLRLIDRTAKTEQDYAGHDDAVGLCRFTPSGRRLFTASYNEILVWEVQSR